MDIGSNIKKVRELKGISQKELSEVSNIPRISLGRYERGEREPGLQIIGKIADALEVELDVILNGIDIITYDREDIFSLYQKLNTKTKLSQFLGFTDDFDINFLTFANGINNDKSLYLKLGEYLNLPMDQIYIWVLSDIIHSTLGWDDFRIPNFSKNDLKYICKNNILKIQSIDSLLNEGLSDENEKLLIDYLSKSNEIKLNSLQLQSKKHEKMVSHTLEEIVPKFEESKKINDNKYTKTSEARRINPLDDLPDDAIKKINEYIEFIRMQYEKDKNDSKEDNEI